MLEEMLWQFGISPQKDYKGSIGARIASNRSDDPGGDIDTLTCIDDEVADRRDLFYAGWDECDGIDVSMEAMVKRFRARNITVDQETEQPKATNVTSRTTQLEQKNVSKTTKGCTSACSFCRSVSRSL